MNDGVFISPYKIKKRFDITSNTLRTWAEKGEIRHIRIRDGLGKRLYNVEDIEKIFGGTMSNNSKGKTCCYARVSSDHQREDLERQIELLRSSYPDADIIKDIGSGLNFKRKGLQTLLERVYSGEINRVVVTYKDRMCRFGFEIIEWIFTKTNTEFLVLNKLTDDKDATSNETSELAEDLLAITTVFVARNNGNRSAKFRKQRKIEEQEKKKIQETSKE